MRALQAALLILHGIEVDDGADGPVASGGTMRVLCSWNMGVGELGPISFIYYLTPKTFHRS